MTQMEANSNSEPSWVPLTPRERRVVGVLAEKGKTTPEYYPLTVAALVAGCNQKSNRDPVTNYDADDVEETLQSLRRKGAVIQVEAGGRVPRWKHTLYDWLKVNKAELAVITELLLRGPQTEGELRSRASRMEPLPDLATLQKLLEALASRALVVFLSPPGQRRGVMVTHGLYPPAELEKVRQSISATAPALELEGPAESSAGPRNRLAAPPYERDDELALLRAEVDRLRDRIEELARDLRDLRAALGADPS
jgi:uncharacterized protein YceH (UPF0502 family)